jgi:hypothetical protein
MSRLRTEYATPGQHEIVTAPKRANYAPAVITYHFFALAVGFTVWNATTGGTLSPTWRCRRPWEILAEAVVFFPPAWALTPPIGRQVLAWALFSSRSSRGWIACT